MGNVVKTKRVLTGGDSSSSSSGGALTFKRTFTPAEWRTLFTVPITLIAGQGTNSIICIVAHTVVLKYHGGTTSYNFAGNDFDIIIGGGATLARTTDSTNYTSGVIFDAFGNAPAVTNGDIALTNTGADATLGDRIPVLSFKYYIMDVSQ